MSGAQTGRKWRVGAFVTLGVIGLSVASVGGRALGPSGRASGGASGCQGGDDIEQARTLVSNPEVVDTEREDPIETVTKTSPYDMSDNRYIVELESPEAANDPAFIIAMGEIGAPTQAVPFVTMLAPKARSAAGDFDNFFVVESDRPRSVVMERLGRESVVTWADPVTTLVAMSADSGRSLQWNLDVVREPWIASNTNRGEGTVIAVLDTGYTRGGAIDLAGEQACWNYVERDEDCTDGHGHGTLVAHVIGQQTPDGVGFSGIASAATVRPSRVLNDQGVGNTLDLAAAIVSEALLDADVILMPLGGYSPSLMVAEALTFADSHGSFLVAAAGNQGLQATAFPASHVAVLSVGAVNPHLEVAPYSNLHADILAPGGDLQADLDEDGVADGVIAERTGEWVTAEGTSFAAAHVAAVAAVALADGESLRPEQLREAFRVQGQDLVLDAEQVVERARGIRIAPTEISATIPLQVSRLHHAPFRVEVSWGTSLPGDTECTWDEGRVAQAFPSGTHRAVLDLSPDHETAVVCTTRTGKKTVLATHELLLLPPSLAVSRGADCEALGGDFADPIQVNGEWTGSTGALCTAAAE